VAAHRLRGGTDPWPGVTKGLIQMFRRKGRTHQDFQEEIASHLEIETDRFINEGMSPEDARAAALRRFGNVMRATEHSYETGRVLWFDQALSDARYAFRTLIKSPAFSLITIVIFALSIAAAGAVVSVLNALFWKPLPVSDPRSLVEVHLRYRDGRETDGVPAELGDRLKQSSVFSDVIKKSSDGLSFAYDDRAERIVGEFVSPNYFEFLGLQPAVGQAFTADVREGNWAPEVVLSYRFWKTRFNGDPNVVGRVIHLNTFPFTIVGVSPESFLSLKTGFDPELRLPILPSGRELSQLAQIGGSPKRNWTTIGRLKSGQSITQTEAAADSQLAAEISETSIAEIRQAGFQHLQLVADDKGAPYDVIQFQAPLFVLLGLSAAVVLIACSNVASMMLVRSTARLGASRNRLLRQLVTEGLLLAVPAGLLGIAVGQWIAGVLVSYLPQGHMTMIVNLVWEPWVVLASALLALAQGILCGSLAAANANRGNLVTKLKTDSDAAAGQSSGLNLRKMLVISQVGFCFVLLLVAALFIRVLSNLRPSDFRTRTDQVLLFTLKPQPEIYRPDRVRNLTSELVRRVAGLPGVETAAIAENGPLGSRSNTTLVQTPGHDPVRIDADWVTSNFFKTVGITQIAGRDFTMADTRDTLPVVIINESLAGTLFPNQNPIGKTIQWPNQGPAWTGAASNEFTIVGAVSDTHYYDVHKQPGPGAWFAIAQFTPYMPTLHVRTTTRDTAVTIAAVRKEFDAIDRGFPVFAINTFQSRIENSLSRERLVADVATGFGFFALVLAVVGLYGIIAYSVAQRKREIAIRMALGAPRYEVMALVMRQGLALTLAGIVLGCIVALALSRYLRAALGMISMDAMVIVSVAATFVAIAVLASYFPARRATKVDPLAAMRND
jgi:predicted permease